MAYAERFIGKMRRWSYFLLVNIALAVGILLCAILGRSLGIEGPALPISVVWPATGLSLAALLLFGNRASVGVLAGNLIYNFLYLTAFPPTLPVLPLYAEMAAVAISLGSFAQAYFSAYILRTYSKPPYFRTVNDIFIFLIPASFLSCLIGSTIGVISLYFVGGVETSLVIPVWLTFWLGDAVGIYVVTPLLVVWALQSEETRFSSHILSIICMASLFILFAFFTYRYSYPLPHLFVPISIWAAYLFRMHGASLAIFLMTAASVAFAASQGYEGTSLISLITFIAVTIAASLIIAAVVNEREEAWALLDSRNIYLEQEVEVKADFVQLARFAADQKRKLVSQGIEAKHVTQEMHVPLHAIEHLSKSSLATLEEVIKQLAENHSLSAEGKKNLVEKLHLVKNELSDAIEAQQLILALLDRLQNSK